MLANHTGLWGPAKRRARSSRPNLPYPTDGSGCTSWDEEKEESNRYMEGKALIKARILKKRRTPPDRFSFLFEMGYLKGHVAEEDQSLRKITVSD
ncbi:hypothetical protein UY3_09512 [Chelonia mydas]|uniref:Uncharacterized protein n=1 Tax=Chelonia mydas TaxID=8469 RepID=M7BMY0_CHEMY|nr:hypothetical protein UY3_09512 [Chelonia mydas]